MPEISEQELLELRTLQTTVGAMLKNPKARRKVLEAQKDVNPKADIPELDTPDPIEERFASSAKQVADLQKQIADDKAEREKNETIARLQGQQSAQESELRRAGWTDSGIAEVKKLADEKGILDLKVVADHYEKMHPPQDPVQPRGTGGWNFLEQPADGDADIKALIESKGENPSLLDKMARDALNEFRGNAPRR